MKTNEGTIVREKKKQHSKVRMGQEEVKEAGWEAILLKFLT